MKSPVAICFLAFALMPVCGRCATAECTSGNCTVNTLTFSLTTVSNPKAVGLKWPVAFGGAVYDIYRDGKLLKLNAGLLASDNWHMLDADTTAVYGQVHRYEVRVRNSNLRASASGMRRGERGTPSLVEVAASDLWLVDSTAYTKKSSYNLLVKFNFFDPEMFKVKELHVEVSEEDSVDCDFSKHDMYDVWGEVWTVDLREYGLKIKNHKEHVITVRVKYEDLITKQEYDTDSITCNVNVYFDKYSSGTPAWFDNWGKDGAVPGLSGFGYRDKIVTDQDDSKTEYGAYLGDEKDKKFKYLGTLSKISDSGQLTIDGVVRTYPEVWKITGGYIEEQLLLARKAASSVVQRKTSRAGNVGESGVGIKATAILCAHEKEHKKTAHDLIKSGNKFRHFLDYRKMSLKNLTSDADWKALEDYANSGACPEKVRKYAIAVQEAFEDPDCATDVDGDGVRDGYEADLGLTTVGDADTWGFKAISRVYADCGDDEYLSSLAESEAEFHPEKDWAFPGAIMESSQEHQGMTKQQWDKERTKEIGRLEDNYNGVYRVAKGKLTKKKSVAKVMRQSSEVAIENLVEEAVDESFILTLPDVGGLEQEGSLHILGVSDGEAGGGASDYTNLVFKVTVSNDVEESVCALLSGYLVDESGVPAIKVCKRVDIGLGTASFDLVFSAEMLYRAYRTGYRLKLATVQDLGSTLMGGGDFWQESSAPVHTYGYLDFRRPDGCFIRQSVAVAKVADGLAFEADYDVAGSGIYAVRAQLATTNGDAVAMAEVEGLSCSDRGHVSLIFAGHDIYQTKFDGPYILKRLVLFDGEKELDLVENILTTQPYSYRDFASGEEILFADPGSFAREPDSVGSDGLCDALNFSFSVTNLAATESSAYRARMYLYGTNDQLVCSATHEVVLSNLVNKAVVSFGGVEIKAKGIEGPYYVAEVAIEDLETGTIIERFTPVRQEIDMCLDDFGEAPVEMNGAAELREGTDETPLVAVIPIYAARPGKVTASAVLVSMDGKPVTRVEVSKTFEEEGGVDGELTLSFSREVINASGIRGPYQIIQLVLASDHEGVEEVHVDDLNLNELECEFRLFVDAANGNDEGDGLSWATAKATIRGALECARGGDTIVVNDGVYEPFECRGFRSLIIRSVNGAENTVIDGEHQLCCAELGGNEIVLHGFTLRNGWSDYDFGGVYGGHVENCIITGCRSEDCGGGAGWSELVNCLVYGNSCAVSGGGAYGGLAVHCTIAANDAGESGGGVAEMSCVNSIVYGNTVCGADAVTANYSEGARMETCCTAPLPFAGNNMDEDPLLVDPVHGNLHLRSASPCINAAEDGATDLDCDVYGQPRKLGDAPEIGAIEGAFEDRFSVSVTVEGVGSATPESSLVNEGESVIIVAQPGPREFAGFLVNGDASLRPSPLVLDSVMQDYSVLAKFKSGVIYVSAEGSDANDGLTPDTAKSSIQAGVDAAEVGECVYVGPGVYAPFVTDNKSITVIGTEGVEKTIVDAQGIGMCACLGADSQETKTTICGFTLRNGYAIGGGAGACGGTIRDCRIVSNRTSSFGGGVRHAYVDRCLVAFNRVEVDESEDYLSAAGGGAYGCTLCNCLVVSNVLSVTSGDFYVEGAGAAESSLYGCTVCDNVLTAISGGDDSEAHGAGIADCDAYNTIVWHNMLNGAADDEYDTWRSSCLWLSNPSFISGTYRPSPSSPCVDAGDSAWVFGAYDYAGTNRVLWGLVDIGAYESVEEKQGSASGGGGGAAEPELAQEPEPATPVELVRPTRAFAAPAAVTMSGAVLSADGQSVAGVVQLKVGKEKKGESKVSLTLIGKDGRKYTAKAVNVPVGAGLREVTFDVKGYGPLTLTLGADGFIGKTDDVLVAAVDDEPPTGPAAVELDLDEKLPVENVLTDYLPTDITVERTAKKWTLPKAGKLKYDKKTGELVATGDNIAGLKLTYAPKTQTVKGSFKIWTFDAAKQKIKSVSASVTGVVVGGVAYCDVSVKKQKIGEMIVK